jgi:SAM-dependent methyltransferase
MRNEIALSHKGLTGSTLLKGKQIVYRIRNKVRMPLPLFRVVNRNEETFECPICGYEGPFARLASFGGFRKHAVCPKCGSYERHRLQYLAIKDCFGSLGSREIRMLHFAPEDFLRQIFSRQFARYETADLFMEGVDHKVDIRELPFEDGSYDIVFASHVLEHISDDRRAIKEIRRILRPGGRAFLAVPIVCDKTIEYSEPSPYEAGHVRAPGPDYFDKYKEYFETVKVYSSESFPPKYQVFVYEDRTKWPTPECPMRPPMQGEKHADFVPVCYV